MNLSLQYAVEYVFFLPWIHLYKLFTWIYLYEIMFDIFLHYTNLAFNKGGGSRGFHTFLSVVSGGKKRNNCLVFFGTQRPKYKGNQLLHERLPKYYIMNFNAINFNLKLE